MSIISASESFLSKQIVSYTVKPQFAPLPSETLPIEKALAQPLPVPAFVPVATKTQSIKSLATPTSVDTATQ